MAYDKTDEEKYGFGGKNGYGLCEKCGKSLIKHEYIVMVKGKKTAPY
jgi:hypothetical protein